MSRLDKVIAQVKNANAKGDAWVFEDTGEIASGVICGNVIPFLEDLKEYEVDASDAWIDAFLEHGDIEGSNTYNNAACISNDIEFKWGKGPDMMNYFVIAVHLRGDIRGNYSDYFVLQCDWEDIYNCESVYQNIPINDRYVADVDIFAEGYSVYDCELGEDIGEFYELEVSDLLNEIEAREGE